MSAFIHVLDIDPLYCGYNCTVACANKNGRNKHTIVCTNVRNVFTGDVAFYMPAQSPQVASKSSGFAQN